MEDFLVWIMDVKHEEAWCVYQYGHGEILSDVLQGSHILPGDIRHGGEALPLGWGLDTGQRGLEVWHEDGQAGQLFFWQCLCVLQQTQQVPELPLLDTWHNSLE